MIGRRAVWGAALLATSYGALWGYVIMEDHSTTPPPASTVPSVVVAESMPTTTQAAPPSTPVPSTTVVTAAEAPPTTPESTTTTVPTEMAAWLGVYGPEVTAWLASLQGPLQEITAASTVLDVPELKAACGRLLVAVTTDRPIFDSPLPEWNEALYGVVLAYTAAGQACLEDRFQDAGDALTEASTALEEAEAVTGVL